MTYNAQWYHELFEKFKDLRVLIIGDVMIDAYIWGHVDRISPEAPVPVVMVGGKYSRLGGAANVALNIRSMGATPLLCSVIGDDTRGDEFIQLLNDEAISSEGIVHSSNRPTTIKSRIIGNNVQMLRIDEEAIHPLIEEDQSRLLQVISHILTSRKPHAIIFQDYDKGVLTPTLIGEVIRKAHEAGIPVTVDPKKNQFRAYKGVTLFKPNFKELREGTGVQLPKGFSAQLEDTVTRLCHEMNAGQVMVTLSEDGVYYCRNNGSTFESGHLPAHRRKIADVSGAGDTVISVATLCIAAGCNPACTANLANLAGGIVCEEAGVVPIKSARLLEEIIRLFA